MSNYRYVHAVGKHSFLQDMISPKQRDACAKMFEALEVRAENAEAQLEKALEQGKPYLKERYDSVCSANGRLHVENAELRAEVDSLKHFIQEREDCIIFPSMLTQLGLKTRAERKAQRGGE